MLFHRISVPTPFPVGPVNVYLIEEDPLTLIDTGPRTDQAIAALRSGLSAIGYKLSDIKRVILTHAHADHTGLAKLIVEESAGKAFIHAWDAPAVAGPDDYSSQRRLLTAAGVHEEAIEKMRSGYETLRRLSPRLSSVEILEDEDDLEFEHESLRVIHTPGHTPGSICLLRCSSRLMFAADTVLKHITPNPVLNADPIDPRKRFQSLGEYLVSLARIRSLAPTLLKGGHGGDVTEYDQYFMRLRRFTEARQSKLLSLIPPGGATAWVASSLLFPRANGHDKFLAVSETVAHLDYAVSEGRLTMDQDGAHEVYREIRD